MNDNCRTSLLSVRCSIPAAVNILVDPLVIKHTPVHHKEEAFKQRELHGHGDGSSLLRESTMKRDILIIRPGKVKVVLPKIFWMPSPYKSLRWKAQRNSETPEHI